MAQRWPIRICGTGVYVPAHVLTNQYFAERLDTSDEWIVTRTGIRERRQAAQNESTSTLAAKAAAAAIENAGLQPSDIDAIICATATGDCPFPATATFVQAQLGVPNVPAFDVGAACAGFLYGSSIAAAYLSSRAFRHVLVVGAETLTRYADPEDRATVVLFGDAAGAAVYAGSNDPERGILYSEIGCDGTKADLIVLPAGGSRLPASAMTVAERLHYIRMKGREVFKFAVGKMEELIDRALHECQLTAHDLKLIIPHQSNLRIMESFRERYGLPHEKLAVNIDRFGNTSAASIMLSLDEARRNGQLAEGDAVLLIAVGAGLTWGVMLLRL